jgi:hypothetical protein
MAATHIKKLEALKEKGKDLQSKIERIKSDILADLSVCLVDANALDIDFDILIGGMLEVVEKTQQGDKIAEVWKSSGEKFRQRRKKKTVRKNKSSSKKDAQGKENDQ